MINLPALSDALLLQAGYNTTVVTLGSLLLGAAAGAIGTFILLRRRSLASDAAGHATLPGLTLAFIAMALISGDGKWLPGLMIGAALSATLGLYVVHLISSYTRLPEDAAIGAVLSVFFGAGVVLLTVIQTMETGNQAGIGNFLLGSAAGMLRSEAQLVAWLAVFAAAIIFVLRRPFTLLCFDPQFAAVNGLKLRRTDLALSALLLAVIVISLKIVGLILSVALVIIPPVAARFWTDRVHYMVSTAAAIGGIGAYFGAALSSIEHNLPTGSLIVLSLFTLFVLSMCLAPRRGLLATALRHQAFRRRVHRRQGLLALSRCEAIYDGLTVRLLKKDGHIRGDGVATLQGEQAARQTAHEEALWALYRHSNPGDALLNQYHRVRPIREVLPQDTVSRLERLHSENIRPCLSGSPL